MGTDEFQAVPRHTLQLDAGVDTIYLYICQTYVCYLTSLLQNRMKIISWQYAMHVEFSYMTSVDLQRLTK